MNGNGQQPFKTWSTEEEERLLVALQAQRSLADIAKSHCRSVRAIEMRIEMMIRRIHTNSGKSIKEISKLFLKPEAEVEKIISSNNNPTTTAKSEKLKEIEETLEKIWKKQKKMNEKLDLILSHLSK